MSLRRLLALARPEPEPAPDRTSAQSAQPASQPRESSAHRSGDIQVGGALADAAQDREAEESSGSVGGSSGSVGGLSALVRSTIDVTKARKGRTQCASDWDRANHMRLQGTVTRLKGGPALADHVQRKIDKANLLAKRPVDRIDTTEKRPIKVKGKGAYKKWTPEACLRAAFGRPLVLAKTKDDVHIGAPLRGSVTDRVMADFYEACHTHIRKIRCAMAYSLLYFQRLFLSHMPAVLHIIWVACLDESEVSLCQEQQRGRHHLQMLHFLFAARASLQHPLLQKQIVAAPATLLNQSSLALWRGLEARAPIPFVHLARKARRTMLCLVTDSANACKGLGMHCAGVIAQIRESETMNLRMVYFIHVFCLMHQIALAIDSWVRLQFLLNPIYCAQSLLSMSSNLEAMKVKLREACNSIHVSFLEEDKPTEQQIAYGESVLALMEYGDEDWRHLNRVQRSKASQERRLKRKSLAKFITFGSQLWVHFCDGSCGCIDEQDARDRAYAMFLALLLICIPSPPCASRWTKVVPPIGWWAMGAFLPFRLLFQLFSAIKGNSFTTDAASDIPMTQEDLAGIDENEHYQRKQGARWIKAQNWLKNPLTPIRLLVTMLVLAPVVSLMGSFFTDASDSGMKSPGIGEFLHPSTSPAVHTLLRYFAVMTDLRNTFWTPLLFHGWNEVFWVQVFSGCCLLVGQIWLRLVWRFQRFPWLLGTWFHRNSTAAERTSIKAKYNRANRCCCDLGLTRAIRIEMTGDELEENHEAQAFINDSFESAPWHNMGCEFKFARVQTHVRACHQKVPSAENVCAKHVLAESAGIHRHCMEEQRRFDPRLQIQGPGKADKGASKLASGSWKAYMAKNSSNDFAALSSAWGAMTAEEKQREAPERPQRDPGSDGASKVANVLARAARVVPEELCSGGRYYPLSVAQASSCTDKIDGTFKQWREYIRQGINVGDNGDTILKPSLRICADTWHNRCSACLNGPQKSYLRNMVCIGRGMLSLHKQACTPVWHRVLPPPKLYNVHGSTDRQLVLCLSEIQKPARGAFFLCSALGDLEPGTEVRVQMNMEGLIETRELAERAAFFGNPLKVDEISYKPRGDFISLEFLVVTGVCDQTAAVFEAGKSALSADDDAPLEASEALVPAPSPVPDAKSSPTPKAMPKATNAATQVADFMKRRRSALQKSNAAERMPAPVGDKRKRTRQRIRLDGQPALPGVPHDMPALPPIAEEPHLVLEDADKTDMMAGVLEHLGHPSEPEPEWIEKGLLDVAREVEAEVESERPIINKKSPTEVIYATRPDYPIGTIKYLNQGRPNEKFIITCKRHGKDCVKFVSGKRMPNVDLVMEWYHHGCTKLKPGAEFAAEHKGHWFSITGLA